MKDNLSKTQKKDCLWNLWCNGPIHDNRIINSERVNSLIPIKFVINGDGYTIISDIGESSLSIEEISKYGIIETTLYRYSIRKLLKASYGIDFGALKSHEKIIWEEIEPNLHSDLLEKSTQRIKEIHTPRIFIKGREKTGKTILAKTYCSESFCQHGNPAYYLDFNRGYFDFCDFIDEFSALPKDRSRKYAILLDHLYCCNVETAEKILTFFCNLENVLKKSGILLKLIVTETPENIFNRSAKDNTISLDVPREISISCQFIQLYDADILINQYLKQPNLSKDSNKLGEALYEKLKVGSEFSLEEYTLFYKILVLSASGFNIIIDGKDRYTLLNDNGLFSKITGLIVYRNIFSSNSFVVSFFKFDTARLILDYLEDKFGKKNISHSKKSICTKYLREHFDIGALTSLLKNQKVISLNDEKNQMFLKDYLYLTNYCIEKKREIVKEVNSSSNDEILGNHLGRILFALETIIGIKEGTWEDQRAIIKIKTLVRNMYFISKEVVLPNINYLYIDKERTVADFFTKEDLDTIQSQIELQDILLHNYKFQEDIATLSPENTEQFAYYLTDLQKKYWHVNDYNQFFQTYLLALLLEFESTMIEFDKDEERLEVLLDRVFRAAQYNTSSTDNSDTDDNYCFFYPARVPWVTGRMYLALSSFLHKNDHDEANKIKIKIERWIKLVSHQFILNGKECCIWCAGTGNWNTVLDTTILCMSAMEFREPKYFSSAKEYILAREHDWLTPNNLTSGISALEILSDTMNTSSIHMLKEKLESLIENEPGMTEEHKSDGAMGDSQIAQKIVSLCNKYSKHAIETLSERLYSKKETNSMEENKNHYKIGITFSGFYREKYVEPFCNELLNLNFCKDDIFYDLWHEVQFNGPHGDEALRNIYLNCCDCVVVLLSPDYKEKNWTGRIEWPAVLELINTGRDERICLLGVEKIKIGDIPGLYDNQAIIKFIDNISAKEVAKFIQKKYQKIIG